MWYICWDCFLMVRPKQLGIKWLESDVKNSIKENLTSLSDKNIIDVVSNKRLARGV